MNTIPITEVSQFIIALIWLSCIIVGAAVGSLIVDLKSILKERRKKNEG